MLKWLKQWQGPKHKSVRDVAGIRQALSALPAGDAYRSLEEVRFWISFGLERPETDASLLYETLRLLDATARPHHRRLLRDYLQTGDRQQFRESRVWLGLANYHRDMTEACLALCERDDITAEARLWLFTNAVHQLNASRKLRYFRYLTPDARLWRQLGDAVQGIGRHGLTQHPVKLHETAHPTSPAIELISGLMVDISMLWNLSPLRMEVASRACRLLATDFEAGETSAGGARFGFDPLLGEAPRRLAEEEAPAFGCLLFAPGPARPKLVSWLENPSLILPQVMAIHPGLVERSDVLETLRHLDRHWAPVPVRRGAPRSGEQSMLFAIVGLKDLLSRLETTPAALSAAAVTPAETDAAAGSDDTQLRPACHNEAGVTVCAWQMTDRAPTGYGALMPREAAMRVEPGVLLGLTPDDSDQLEIGLVRRMARDAELNHIAGVQVLSARTPQSGLVRRDTELPQSYAAALGELNLKVLVLAQDKIPGVQRILAPAGQLFPGNRYQLMLGEQSRLFTVIEVVERGRDFDLITID